MKSLLVVLAVAFSLGCEVQPGPYPSESVYVKSASASSALCEYNFYNRGPLYYNECVSYSANGDCGCYRVVDPSVATHECFVDYCFYWDTCQWEIYDSICY